MSAADPTRSGGDAPALARRPSVRLLGSFHLTGANGRPARPGIGAQRVVGLLAIRHRRIARRETAELLWPSSTSTRALACLRTAVHRLTTQCPEMVIVESGHLSLADDVRVDLDEAVAAAREVLGDSPAAGLGALPASVRQELLPDWPDEEWLETEREHWRMMRLDALEADADRLAATGRHGAAIDALRAVQHLDPYRESAYRRLLEVYLAQGNRVAAMRCAADFRTMLRRELDLPPPFWLDRVLAGIDRVSPGRK